jgi:2-(1,2-epoxy-1,2-dihydrophenyl)acetyl-CoA isomerase
MDFKMIKFSISGGVATVTLARPERLNALNAGVHAEIRTVLDQVEANDEIRCLVITGEGRAFCSGQDLTERVATESKPIDTGASLDRDYNPLVRRLAGFKLPTIAAVNGPAVGAGANLALACDILLFARSAYLQEAFTRIGLVPDAGGTWFLPRLVGLKHALAMSLTAELIPADECARIGIAWKVFDDAVFAAEVGKFAAVLAGGPTLAYRLTKQALNASYGTIWPSSTSARQAPGRPIGRFPRGRSGLPAEASDPLRGKVKRTPVDAAAGGTT